MREVFFLFFLFLVLITPVYAFDCSLVADSDTCASIQKSDLSNAEKEELYQALLYTEFPDYEYVSEHNTNIEWDEVPEGVTEHDSEYIKDAWIVLASVMPSVSIEDSLYYNGEAEILTGYNYDIQTQTGTTSGDCKTVYDVNSISRSFKVYADNKIIGYTDVVSFTSDENVTLKTQMTITVEVSIQHYTKQKNKYGGKTCKYSSTEKDSDTLTISDSKEIISLNNEPSYSLEIEDQSFDSYRGILDITDATAFDFSIGEGVYQKREWYYTYDLSYAPYSILTVVAEPYEKEISDNINVNEGVFTVQDITPCSLTLYSHFTKQTYDCEQNYTDEDIHITTDKQYYSVGEPIEVSISPSDQEVLLTYGDTEEIVKGSVNLTATQSGLIQISSGGKSDTSQVYVISEKWNIVWSLAVFGVFLYIFSNVSLFFWKKVHI